MAYFDEIIGSLVKNPTSTGSTRAALAPVSGARTSYIDSLLSSGGPPAGRVTPRYAQANSPTGHATGMNTGALWGDNVPTGIRMPSLIDNQYALQNGATQGALDQINAKSAADAAMQREQLAAQAAMQRENMNNEMMQKWLQHILGLQATRVGYGYSHGI